MALIKDTLYKKPQSGKPPLTNAAASQDQSDNAEDSSNAEGASDDSDKPTPQEQDAYERVVMAGLKIIYDQSTHDGIVNMLKSGDPATALAQTASTIMLELDKKSGGKIPDVVILPAAAEILGELAKLGTTAKLFDADERVLAVAMQKLVLNLGQQYGVEPQDLQALMQSLPKEQIQQIVAQQSQADNGSSSQSDTNQSGA